MFGMVRQSTFLKLYIIISFDVYNFSFKIICVKDSLIIFYFYILLETELFFNVKRKRGKFLVGKETWEVMKMASHLGTFNFRAIIVFTVTSQQNGSSLYIISYALWKVKLWT